MNIFFVVSNKWSLGYQKEHTTHTGKIPRIKRNETIDFRLNLQLNVIFEIWINKWKLCWYQFRWRKKNFNDLHDIQAVFLLHQQQQLQQDVEQVTVVYLMGSPGEREVEGRTSNILQGSATVRNNDILAKNFDKELMTFSNLIASTTFRSRKLSRNNSYSMWELCLVQYCRRTSHALRVDE